MCCGAGKVEGLLGGPEWRVVGVEPTTWLGRRDGNYEVKFDDGKFIYVDARKYMLVRPYNMNHIAHYATLERQAFERTRRVNHFGSLWLCMYEQEYERARQTA